MLIITVLGGRLFSRVPLRFHQFRGVWGPGWGPKTVSSISVGPLDRIRPGEPCFRHRVRNGSNARVFAKRRVPRASSQELTSSGTMTEITGRFRPELAAVLGAEAGVTRAAGVEIR